MQKARIWNLAQELNSLLAVVHKGQQGDNILSSSQRQGLAQGLVRWRRLSLELGLKAASITLAKMDVWLKKPTATAAECQAFCEELTGRMSDELMGTVFLYLDDEESRLHDEPLEGLEAIIERFPSTIFDFEEAAKCLALSRYTACVFHSTRISEAVLTIIAKRVGLISHRPGWEESISYIEGQVKKNYVDMDVLFKGDVDFLSGIAAHMRDVNIAWRRRVAHVESKYTEEEARRIYDATKALAQHIATKLSEL